MIAHTRCHLQQLTGQRMSSIATNKASDIAHNIILVCLSDLIAPLYGAVCTDCHLLCRQ